MEQCCPASQKFISHATKIRLFLFRTWKKLNGRPLTSKKIGLNQRLPEEFKDTKGVSRIHKSKKDRQHNGQKKKVQKDKQRFTKHTHKAKDRVTLAPREWFRCSGRVHSSCSTSGTCRVNLVTNSVISHEWGKDREVLTTSGTYPWSFVTQIFYNGHFTT